MGWPDIYRISTYVHHDRDDNIALVAADGPLEAQDLLKEKIAWLNVHTHLADNYRLRGRIDEVGVKATKQGVVYMTLPWLSDVRQKELLERSS